MTVHHLDDHRDEAGPVRPELQPLDDVGVEFRVFVHGRPVGGVWADETSPMWWWTVAPGLPAHGTARDRAAAVRALCGHLSINVTVDHL